VLAGHIFAYTRLADFDAEFEEFAMDTQGAPVRIRPTHCADQLSDFFGDLWPPRPAARTLPVPRQAEALAVPGDDGFGLNNGKGGLPIGPDPAEGYPEETIGQSQLSALGRRPLQHTNLMAKSEVFWL